MVLMARKKMGGFPGGLNGKESICQCRRHGLDPWLGKTPHTEQLNPCATTTEPVLQSPGTTAPEVHAPQSLALQQEGPPQ